jgi:hypothetical protein
MKIAMKRAKNKAAHDARNHKAETEEPPDDPDTDEIPVVPPETSPS